MWSFGWFASLDVTLRKPRKREAYDVVVSLTNIGQPPIGQSGIIELVKSPNDALLVDASLLDRSKIVCCTYSVQLAMCASMNALMPALYVGMVSPKSVLGDIETALATQRPCPGMVSGSSTGFEIVTCALASAAARQVARAVRARTEAR